MLLSFRKDEYVVEVMTESRLPSQPVSSMRLSNEAKKDASGGLALGLDRESCIGT